jgi:hypothetical protein
MGTFKKIGAAVKGALKAVPVVGNVVKAADNVYSALKSSKKSKSSTTAGTNVKSKVAAGGQWFAWAPNWAILTVGFALLAGILYAIFGKKKRRRR